MIARHHTPHDAGRLHRATIRPLAMLVLFAVAASLAACGTAEDSGSDVLSAKDLATVASKTAAKGGVRISMQQTMTLPGQGSIPTTAEGSFDSRSKRGEMTLQTDLSGLAGGDATGGGKQEQTMILDGLTIYMRSDGFARLLPAGKKWMKIDLDAVGKEAGIDLGAIVGAGGQDPTQALQYLKAASGKVTRVGTEEVRGASTTHYKGTIDFRKVPDFAPADQREAVRKSVEQIIKLGGTSKAPIEVWIGDDGVARRILTTIATEIAGQRTKIMQRIELHDFGTKVDVKIPPAAETVDIGDLGALGGLDG